MNGPFRISERTHAGFLLMTRLAEAYESSERVTIKDVASSMRISEGYLEEIAARLKQADLIKGRTGPNGGYILTQDPATITAEQIVTALEGPIALVECQTGVQCPVQHACASQSLWGTLQKKILESLRETKLAEIVN